MNGEALTYRRQALLGDYLRSVCGALLTGLPMLFVTGSPATLAILGGLTALTSCLDKGFAGSTFSVFSVF